MMAAPVGRYSGFTSCARALLAEGGVPAFYRGYQAAILRAFPANAAAFTAADMTMRFLNPTLPVLS